MDIIEEMNSPKWMLLSSDLANDGMTLSSSVLFGSLRFRRDFM